MNGNYYLDTNIVTALIRGEAIIQERIANAITVNIPCIVLGNSTMEP